MNQTVEHVVLDEDYTVIMVTTELLPGVHLITCEEEQEATLMINDADIHVKYTPELASIIENMSDYTAEQLLMSLAQVDRLVS